MRTLASPSATTNENVMDYNKDDPMPPPHLGMGGGGGIDDKKVVCKFAPVSQIQRWSSYLRFPCFAYKSCVGRTKDVGASDTTFEGIIQKPKLG